MPTMKPNLETLQYSDEDLRKLVQCIFVQTSNRVYGVELARRLQTKKLPSDHLLRDLKDYAPLKVLKEIFPDTAYDQETVVQSLREYQTRVLGSDTTPSIAASCVVSPEDRNADAQIDGPPGDVRGSERAMAEELDNLEERLTLLEESEKQLGADMKRQSRETKQALVSHFRRIEDVADVSFMQGEVICDVDKGVKRLESQAKNIKKAVESSSRDIKDHIDSRIDKLEGRMLFTHRPHKRSIKLHEEVVIQSPIRNFCSAGIQTETSSCVGVSLLADYSWEPETVTDAAFIDSTLDEDDAVEDVMRTHLEQGQPQHTLAAELQRVNSPSSVDTGSAPPSGTSEATTDTTAVEGTTEEGVAQTDIGQGQPEHMATGLQTMHVPSSVDTGSAPPSGTSEATTDTTAVEGTTEEGVAQTDIGQGQPEHMATGLQTMHVPSSVDTGSAPPSGTSEATTDTTAVEGTTEEGVAQTDIGQGQPEHMAAGLQTMHVPSGVDTGSAPPSWSGKNLGPERATTGKPNEQRAGTASQVDDVDYCDTLTSFNSPWLANPCFWFMLSGLLIDLLVYPTSSGMASWSEKSRRALLAACLLVLIMLYGYDVYSQISGIVGPVEGFT